MSTRLTARLGATALALAFAASPAFAQTSPTSPPANAAGSNAAGSNAAGSNAKGANSGRMNSGGMNSGEMNSGAMNSNEMNSNSGEATEQGSTRHTARHHHANRQARTRHTAREGRLMPTKAGDEAIERLNAESLQAAQSGQTFTPSGTPSSPAATAQPRAGSHGGMGDHDNNM